MIRGEVRGLRESLGEPAAGGVPRVVVGQGGGELEVGVVADEQLALAGQRVEHGELSGRGDAGIEAGGGDHSGDGDAAGTERGVVVAQHVGDLGVALVVGADGAAAAGAGQLQADRVVAEAGDVEEGAAEPLVPRQRDRADAPAEARAPVGELVGDAGLDFEQCRGGGPEVGGAPAVEVGVAVFDAVQDVAGGGIGQVVGGGAVEPSLAEHQNGGGGLEVGEREGRGPAAVAVSHDDADARRFVDRLDEPAADASVAPGVEGDFGESAAWIRRGDFGERDRRRDRAGLVESVLPECLEVVRFVGGRRDAEQGVEVIAIRRVVGKLVGEWHPWSLQAEETSDD